MINKIYKNILITGAADGIGLNLLKRVSKEKIKIYALDKNIRKLQNLNKTIDLEIIKLDLTNTNDIYNKLSKLKIDILICNAGNGRGGLGLLSATRKDIESSTRLNVESYLHLLKVMVPGMIKRRKGHIVLMGSLAGLYPQMSAVYGGQKGAIHRIAQSLRIELSGSRVKVTEICPGRTKTNFAKSSFNNEKIAKKFMSGFTLLEPQDISEAIIFALSTRWRSNISTIEISGTEQSPGGVPVYSVNDPILD
ncbi:SDR family NAD(P)-dependent oxidoreductase [Alphaproteobacteria bacterium]|nr:SDR family NAD(P)-dependent oxidoreductase [Alphaproteobacteria bacterium]